MYADYLTFFVVFKPVEMTCSQSLVILMNLKEQSFQPELPRVMSMVNQDHVTYANLNNVDSLRKVVHPDPAYGIGYVRCTCVTKMI